MAGLAGGVGRRSRKFGLHSDGGTEFVGATLFSSRLTPVSSDDQRSVSSGILTAVRSPLEALSIKEPRFPAGSLFRILCRSRSAFQSVESLDGRALPRRATIFSDSTDNMEVPGAWSFSYCFSLPVSWCLDSLDWKVYSTVFQRGGSAAGSLSYHRRYNKWIWLMATLPDSMKRLRRA